MIKILIVDDDKVIAKHLAKFFGDKLGHKSFVVNNPLEAMPLIEKEAPHVVLLDVFMDQMSGMEVLKQIKEKYGNTVKVIMITVAGEDSQTQAKNLGADDFIRKPFDEVYLRDVVMEKIQEVLGYRKKDSIPADKIPNILIVDDEKETLHEISYFLTRVIECKVDTAESGYKAQPLIEGADYDLVFLDIKMPGMSGLELMKKIKIVKTLPDIIMVTGYADGDVAETAKAAGALDYIPKPIYLENFKRKLKEVLEKKGKYFEKGS